MNIKNADAEYVYPKFFKSGFILKYMPVWTKAVELKVLPFKYDYILSKNMLNRNLSDMRERIKNLKTVGE